MKKLALLATALVATTLVAGEWQNLDDAHYISGPKLSPERFRGKIVFVERWGLHCGPCLASLPHVQALYEKYSKKGVVFIGAHCQEFDKPGILKAIKGGGVTYPVYQFAGLSGAPRAGGIPAPYLVGVDGKVCWNDTGFNAGAAEAAIKQALKDMPAHMHDILLEDIRNNLDARPGFARLRLKEFEKAYPKEWAKLTEERQKLARADMNQLVAVEKECARLRDLDAPNEAARRKRNADIDKALAKAKKLNCPALEKELESLKTP